MKIPLQAQGMKQANQSFKPALKAVKKFIILCRTFQQLLHFLFIPANLFGPFVLDLDSLEMKFPAQKTQVATLFPAKTRLSVWYDISHWLK